MIYIPKWIILILCAFGSYGMGTAIGVIINKIKGHVSM